MNHTESYRIPPEFTVNDFLKNISPNQNMNVPIQFTAFVARENHHEPFSRCHQSIGLTGSQNFGTKMMANIPLRGDFIGELTLRVGIPPLPEGVHWVNGVGYKLLEEIKIRHDETVLYHSSGEAQFILDQANYPRLERIRKDPWLTGYRSPIGETVDVSSTFLRKGSPDGILRIPIQWSFGKKGFSPLPVAAIRDKSLQVEFTLAPMNQLIQSDISADDCITPSSREDLPLSLVTANLDMTIYMIDLDSRDLLLKDFQNRLMVINNIYEFKETGNIINIDIDKCIKRILVCSKTQGNLQENYIELKLKNIFNENIQWYSLDSFVMFNREFMEIKDNYDSDIPLIDIHFPKGFVNGSRFLDLRLDLENLQYYHIIIETMEILELKEQGIYWLYQ
jgi:hypothetical protein